jgi:hypothetical protein
LPLVHKFAVAQTAGSQGVALLRAEGAASALFAAECLCLGGIVAAPGGIAHRGKLRRGEQSHLPHDPIISSPRRQL